MKPAPTIPKAAMPVLFHEPHVEKGFRPVHQPWKSYVLSLFQWHNELMNIWTHLIALIMVLFRGGMWWLEFPILSDPYMWPLGVCLVTMVVLFACSSGAHMFHPRSELTHYVCFMIDYLGIGMFGFGSTVLHYWYCNHEDFLGSTWHQVAIPIGGLLGVITCYCCSYSKIKYRRPYPFVRRLWQIGSVTAIYAWLSIPVWLKITIYAFEGRWEPSFGDHLMQTIWFLLGGFFFGSDIPQRLFPGKFDFIGHSHQFFHICIMMTTSKQMDGVYYDITNGMEILRQNDAPTFLGTWGALLFVIMGSAVVVFNFYKSIQRAVLVSDKETCNGHKTSEKKFETVQSNGSADHADTATTMNGSGEQIPRHRNGWNSVEKENL